MNEMVLALIVGIILIVLYFSSDLLIDYLYELKQRKEKEKMKEKEIKNLILKYVSSYHTADSNEFKDIVEFLNKPDRKIIEVKGWWKIYFNRNDVVIVKGKSIEKAIDNFYKEYINTCDITKVEPLYVEAVDD